MVMRLLLLILFLTSCAANNIITPDKGLWYCDEGNLFWSETTGSTKYPVYFQRQDEIQIPCQKAEKLYTER